jgi:hypothetical protein
MTDQLPTLDPAADVTRVVDALIEILAPAKKT